MKKTALVLEGGSLRCMFTAGVLDALMREGVTVDGIFGVSAGTLTGVNWVSNQPGRTREINLGFVNDPRYMGMRSLLLHRSIFNFDFMFGEICASLVPFDYKAFHSSPVQFTAVCTDCRTGQPVYFEKSSCTEIFSAMRASASMPLVSPIVSVEGIPCLDGGCSVSIPYQRALDEGYEKLIVVTTREHGYQKPPVPRSMARLYQNAYRDRPQLVRSLLTLPRRYDRELIELDNLERDGRAFVIRPPKPVTVSRTEKDLHKLQALYHEGTGEAERHLAALTAYLDG